MKKKLALVCFLSGIFLPTITGPAGLRSPPDERETTPAGPHDDPGRPHLQGAHLGNDHPFSQHCGTLRSGLVQSPLLLRGHRQPCCIRKNQARLHQIPFSKTFTNSIQEALPADHHIPPCRHHGPGQNMM